MEVNKVNITNNLHYNGIFMYYLIISLNSKVILLQNIKQMISYW